ncbi:MAG: 6,7-dimethyl-8-ribityllumazine synthase [Candidatus Diapherotrites archaeon]|nr:6,7-dimethyl-8-ribityllumazine synthase [Candidatus Diapherotrites archaeon]
MRIGFIVSEYHFDITSMMLERAKEHAKFLGVEIGDILFVPGSLDSPLAAKFLFEKKDIDGVVVLGAVVEGDTQHDEIVAQHAARKLLDLSIQYNKPLGFGISGPGETRLQAAERIDSYAKRAVETVVKLNRIIKK